MSQPSESFAYGFDHGFDLPATVQLSRIGRKVDRWEKTSELINERKVQREIWAKSILKKEEKVMQRINKTNTENTKRKGEDWFKKNETRTDRMGRQKLKEDEVEMKARKNIKAYLKQREGEIVEKAKKEQEIQDKMMEIYDAYTGSKAAEQAKRE